MPTSDILRGKTIVAVEDNVQNRVVYKISLVPYQTRVEFARHGDDTIPLLRVLPQVDLIILDLMLQDRQNGLDIYDKIRALPRFKETPILVISAMDPAVAMPLVRAKPGISGFIAKPITNRRTFVDQLEHVLRGDVIWSVGIDCP